MKSLKEALDEFDFEDEAYENEPEVDERGSIDYDDYGDGNVEGTGDVPDYEEESEDALDSMGMSAHDEDDLEEWFRTINNPEDEKDECEGDEADQWLSAHESIESLNAKEAKLREALRAVRNAKLKLNK